MRRIALKCLVFDLGRLITSVLGVAIATALLLAQIGIYEGMKVSSSRIIRNFGGDVWAMARGTNVIDNAEAISAGIGPLVLAHPCVREARGLIHSMTFARRPDGSYEAVVLVGSDPQGEAPYFPWRMVAGLPSDLGHPMAVTVDRLDARKLGLPQNPMGANFEVYGQNAHVVGVTRGIRSIMVMPYLFTSLDNARAVLGLTEGQVSQWVLDLTHPSCVPDVIDWVERHRDIQAFTTADWAERTEQYWIKESGAGSMLGLTALLGLVVGVVIVGQTLYSLTQQHFKELAMLRVVGANAGELVSFVAWQVLVIGISGAITGTGLAYGVGWLMEQSDIEVSLSDEVVSFGLVVIAVMCLLAAAHSVRAVLRIRGTEVF
ncbi:MAG: ABC transporter permease [Methyloceanibacter sp.]|nr:ABC transporter permease [Methyloceanibacter sp.]